MLVYYERELDCPLNQRLQPASRCNGCPYFDGEVERKSDRQVIGVLCQFGRLLPKPDLIKTEVELQR